MPTRTELPKGHKLGSVADPASLQPGNLKFVPGSIYVWTSKDNAVTNDKSQYVAVKIGLAAGGESAAWHIMQGSRTKLAGDQIIIDMLAVNNCGWSEEYIHTLLREQGYSTLHGHDHKVPERYKHFYSDQAGGNEWFVMTRTMLDKFMARLALKSYDRHGKPDTWKSGWVGETAKNSPVTFRLNAIGQPTADMAGRRGGPIKEQKLKFIWDYRTLTGFAPVGCVTTDSQWVATR